MRNETLDTTSTSYFKGWEGVSGWYKDKSSGNTLHGGQMTKMSGRSGVIHSNGISPTAYNAYRVSCNAKTFKIKRLKKSTSRWTPGYYNEVAYGTYGYTNPQLLAVGLGGPPSWLPQVNDSIKARARTNALNKLNAGKMDLGETLGDIRQTGHMMARNLASLASAMNHAKKGNMGKAAKALGLTKSPKRSFGKSAKSAANNWLALKFGWLPLMSDIYNGHQAINKAMDDGETWIRVKSVAAGAKKMPIFSALTYKGSLQEGCQVGITMKVDNNTVSGLSQLGLANPLSTAWQLATLSFVVDWFVSVGDFLSALGADIGLQFVTGYETYFVKGTNVQMTYDTPFFGVDETGVIPSWNISVFSMQRVALQSAPPPGLYMKLGLDLGKSVTAVALLTQRG